MFGALKGWFAALSTVGKVGVVTGVSIVTIGATGATSNNQTAPPVEAPSVVKSDNIEHKTVTVTEAVPFETKKVDDVTLAAGTDNVTIEGFNGVRTRIYDVTYTNGTETGRIQLKEEITTQPITKVINHGTYVAPVIPTCPNGTYVNSIGNTVCSPTPEPIPGNSPTARCRDGSYSYSQSRSGTCSHHGGVAEWL